MSLNYERNPLLKFPRNQDCFCGSEKKFKRCCLKYMPSEIAWNMSVLVKENWKMILSGDVTLPPAPGNPVQIKSVDEKKKNSEPEKTV